MYRFLVVVEKATSNYSAYAPDVPGCISTGRTVEETLGNFKEALRFHLEGTLEDGDPVPEPYSVEAQFVEVELPVEISAAS